MNRDGVAALAPAPPAPVGDRLRAALLRAATRRWPKRICAMLRVRNEEEFLDAAVRSIVDSVDDVVIVDNASADATPAVIAALRADFPDKVVVHRYPHRIARVGSETWQLLAASGGASPHLSGPYYTWCLRRCTQPYVLKWDGDMIATAAFAAALADWRRSPVPVLVLQGANVHPDRRHFAAARSTDRAALLAQQRCPAIPQWITSLTHDCPEPRLHPRLLARYDHAAGFTQSLVSPFFDRRWRAALARRVPGASYLHLKFCKRDPYANYSDDLARVIHANLTHGPELDAPAASLLERWGMRATAARGA
jgi:glycosyltransferase involved in cell wall biosynthesis